MPCDTFNTSLPLSVGSTSNYVWFDVEKHSAGAIEIDVASASGGWAVQVLRSARQTGDVGYAMSPDVTFSASGISESMDLTGVKRLGVKVTNTGSGSLTVYLIIKADR